MNTLSKQLDETSNLISGAKDNFKTRLKTVLNKYKTKLLSAFSNRKRDRESQEAHNQVLGLIRNILKELGAQKDIINIPWMENENFSGTLSPNEALKYLTKMLIDMHKEDNLFEDVIEEKEDRRGQVVRYLLDNPGSTIQDMGKAIWGRDINALGRTSTLVITIVRTISSAMKAGEIRRDESKKPWVYYAVNANGGRIGHPVDAPVKRKQADRRFDAVRVENKIKALASKGYIIKKQSQKPDGSWYYKIQEPKNASNDIGTGIGYSAFEYKSTKPNTDYFYHNSHGSDDKKIGNSWNHSPSDSPGPGGWYTFDQNYVEKIINDYASKTAEVAEPVVKAAATDITSVLEKEWPYGSWEGGPKNFDFHTKDRGPRTDHGGEDGESWMSGEEIRRVSKPYYDKWKPRMDRLEADLKRQGINAKVYFDYGEKGHVSLQLIIK